MCQGSGFITISTIFEENLCQGYGDQLQRKVWPSLELRLRGAQVASARVKGILGLN
jgi:hypothetical protein